MSHPHPPLRDGVCSFEQALSSQHDYFSEHPFPGLPFDDVSISEFKFTLEKNDLYRAIAALIQPGGLVIDAACGTGDERVPPALFGG